MRRCCHESVKPIAWLVGTWTSTGGEVFYPANKSIHCRSDIRFVSMGQPLLAYDIDTWCPFKRAPFHLEKGFLRIKPGTNEVAFLLAHNVGVTTLEEGFVNGNEVVCRSTNVARMHFLETLVSSVERTMRLNAKGELEVQVSLSTTRTPMTPFVRAVYTRV